MATPRDRLIGISETARLVGLAEGTIRRLTNEGRVDCTRDSGNRRLFGVAAIKALRERGAKSHNRQRAANCRT